MIKMGYVTIFKVKSLSGIVTALFKLKLSNPSLIGLQHLIVVINTSRKC